MRPIYALLGLILPAIVFGSGKQSSPPEVSKGVELRLWTSSSESMIGGQPITLRAEIYSRGTADFYVGAFLEGYTNLPSHLEVDCVDGSGHHNLLEGGILDFTTQTFKDEWWVKLSPLHYYGREFKLDSSEYEFLGRGGTFRFTAKYVSRGGATPRNVEWDLPPHNAWAGELTSNSVTVRILPVKN